MQISSEMAVLRHGDVWSMASTELQGKIEVPAVGFSMSKYQRWYDALMDRAKLREIPSCYTEVHHIIPRSLGGVDDVVNLVRLTYREHFLAHWFLTKICRGGARRRMQRAFFAMTLPANGKRIIAAWQFDAAKRMIRDLELDPEAERRWYERRLAAREEAKKAKELYLRVTIPEKREANRAKVREIVSSGMRPCELDDLSSQFLKYGGPVRKVAGVKLGKRNGRKPRPSRRIRQCADGGLVAKITLPPISYFAERA